MRVGAIWGAVAAIAIWFAAFGADAAVPAPKTTGAFVVYCKSNVADCDSAILDSQLTALAWEIMDKTRLACTVPSGVAHELAATQIVDWLASHPEVSSLSTDDGIAAAIKAIWSCSGAPAAPAAPAVPPADPPFVAAAKSGDAAKVASLLASGVDPNTVDSDQLTALNWAAYNGHLDVVRSLVQHGAKVDPHAGKSGWTPLMNASAMGYSEVAAYLIVHGADVNARSADGGYTPLMYAVRKSHLDVITLLLNNGADINDTADDKRTALMFADKQSDAAIGALLTARGGRRTAGAQP